MKTVLLHGLGQTAQDWKEVVRHLSTSHVECPELFSSTGNEISYSRILADLEQQYSNVTEPLRICGLSLGALLALDFAIRHGETVVLLSKGEIDSKKVRVEFSLEDMDMSGFQKGATYEQIKAYVLEHTGLKVSSLYISQIKRKCGLDVGQNYNLSKKEDAKVPQCPPEKEAAITEALKFFGMI